MKNLFLVPTEKPSRLRYNLSNVLVLTKESYRDYGKLDNQHLYITNSEEIKKDDWVFVEGQLAPQKARGVLPNGDIECANGIDYVGRKTKKIILTTDPDLIADGVQPIDDEFLEWFVKNPSCNNVEVDLLPYDGTKSIDKYWFGEYKIIIPQEQPKPTPTENAPIKNGDVYDIGRTVNGVSRFLFLNEKWYYFEERLSRECRKDKSELTKLVNDTENDFNEVKYIGNIFSLNLSKNK
jgi:hypothetical protein